ncbi:DUF885 family protein, partial [Steroidobacter sp.]|uniref:DUF885 family protein n=1 Tax=Steroidobacter sp. TaxID=1978227 RepID=UPI001A5AF925
MSYRCLVAVGILSLALVGGCSRDKSPQPAPASAANPGAATAQVDALADELLEHLRSTSSYTRLLSDLPVTEIEDLTFEQAQREAAFHSAALARLQKVGIAELPQDRWLLAKLLEHTYEIGKNAAEDYWLSFAVTPYMGGQAILSIHTVLAGQKIGSQADLDRYLTLVDEYVGFVDQMAAKTRAQAERGIRVPKPALDGVRKTITGLRASAPAALDVAPARLSELAATDVETFRRELDQRIKERVTPAYDQLLAVFDNAYESAAPSQVGLSQYPGGKDNYLRRIVYETGLTLTPQEIHERGLKAVAALDATMQAIRDELKFKGDREAFHKMLRRDPRFLAKTPEDVEARYR